ncbi:MAG: malto-oligosyltrehalose trehalohydrolase [Thermoplasmata archaeon]
MPKEGVEPRERLGSVPDPDGGFHFRVWAPKARRVLVVYTGRSGRRCALRPVENGYFEGTDRDATPGESYWIVLDGHRVPDPASRSQPEGSRGPSSLVDLGPPGDRIPLRSPVELARSVIYELHVGTFSPEGTFDGALAHLPELARTGVTALELLPLPEGGGVRGWGYGGVHQFAVRSAYGGPQGFVRFVDAAHRAGLSVLLDVVYNHWGSEAKFLERFGPYFHPRAITPWGPTPNFSGPGSDEVRCYFFENMRMWLQEYGVDGFRLDAVHEVFDRAPNRFWAEFSNECRKVGTISGTPPVLIAESDLDDVRILRPTNEGGWGLDAQWTDDFHNALHAAVTGEHDGYYVDYGSLEVLARAFERPFLLEGGYSQFRKRRHGAPATGARPDQFVAFDQNHDQVGNRGDGARLTTLLSPGLARVALGLTLFAPYVPMLFMGEEYGERRPFYFFADPPRAFTRRLAAGRMRQLTENGFREPPPDPSRPQTWKDSQLDWAHSTRPEGMARREFVAELLRLRRDVPALRTPGTVEATADDSKRWIAVRRSSGRDAAVLIANLAEASLRLPEMGWSGRWTETFDSEMARSDARPRSGGPTVTLDGGADSPTLPGASFRIWGSMRV